MIMVKGLRVAHTLLGNNNKKKINKYGKAERECFVGGGTRFYRVPTCCIKRVWPFNSLNGFNRAEFQF